MSEIPKEPGVQLSGPGSTWHRSTQNPHKQRTCCPSHRDQPRPRAHHCPRPAEWSVRRSRCRPAGATSTHGGAVGLRPLPSLAVSPPCHRYLPLMSALPIKLHLSTRFLQTRRQWGVGGRTPPKQLHCYQFQAPGGCVCCLLRLLYQTAQSGSVRAGTYCSQFRGCKSKSKVKAPADSASAEDSPAGS